MNVTVCDVAVIGGGPAGAAAAIACARAGARAILLEPLSVGGEALNIPEIEELPDGTAATGPDVVAALTERVLGEGVDLRLGETVHELRYVDGVWRVQADSATVTAGAVVLATGAAPRGLRGGQDSVVEEPYQSGIVTCASCDAPFYRGRRVAVAGGGDTGVGAAIIFSSYASEVVVYERERALTCQDVLARRLSECRNVEVRLGTEVLATAGNGSVEGVQLAEGDTVEPAAGLMLAVGMRPRSDLAAPHAALGSAGEVRVGPDLSTSAPRLFAAGDVRESASWRYGAAWGDGLTAARSALKAIASGDIRPA